MMLCPVRAAGGFQARNFHSWIGGGVGTGGGQELEENRSRTPVVAEPNSRSVARSLADGGGG